MQSVLVQLQTLRLGAPAQPLGAQAAIGKFAAAPSRRQSPVSAQFSVQAQVRLERGREARGFHYRVC